MVCLTTAKEGDVVTEIPLSKGYVALIDDEDVDLVLGFNPKWHVREGPRTQYANAYAQGKRDEGHMLMHRLILNAPPGVPVDHIDRNGLNNTRKNLRLAYGSINQINAVQRNRTGFRGVTLWNGGRQWAAQIRIPGSVGRKKTYLGAFRSPEEAAAAYDAAARIHHGEAAILNFPDQHHQ